MNESHLAPKVSGAMLPKLRLPPWAALSMTIHPAQSADQKVFRVG